METITWSTDLHRLVKTFKKQEIVGNVPNVSTIMHSFSLSPIEKQVVAKGFSANTKQSPRYAAWQ